jgi:hypothetical protein
MWGHRQQAIMDGQRRLGRHYLVMERGYIGDRFTWTSLGFDGLNGRAKFPQIDDGGKRWRQHFEQYLKPWAKPGHKLAVIMGQCRGDSSLVNVDFPHWGLKVAKEAILAGYAPVFRPHPGDSSLVLPGVMNLGGTLETALERASLVVTYNSNSGVDAVLAGVPSYACDVGSMVWGVSSRNFLPIFPNRDTWGQRMAYTQWLPEEIEKGEAWEALKTVFHG